MLLLDPWAITCPAGNMQHHEAEEYVERLTDIHNLSIKYEGLFFISAKAVELLEQADRYPISKGFPESLWPYRPDLLKLLSYLLDRLPKVEDLPVRELLVDSIFFAPHLSARDAQLKHLEDIGARLLLLNIFSRKEGVIFTDGEAAQDSHRLAIELADSECEQYLLIPPGNYEGDIRFAFSLENYFSLINFEWAALNISFEFAISLEIWRRSGRRGSPFSDQPNWSLGGEFEASITRCGINNNPARLRATLRSCADAILRIDLRDTHELRVAKGPGSPQRKRGRDGGAAWRRDIDREFHLHYWSIGERLELANVVFHGESNITE